MSHTEPSRPIDKDREDMARLLCRADGHDPDAVWMMAMVPPDILLWRRYLRIADAVLAGQITPLPAQPEDGIPSRIWGKSYDQMAEEIRGARHADVAVAQLIADARALEREVIATAQAADEKRWRRTGKVTGSLTGGYNQTEWQRPSDGSLSMFPEGFDPNSGTYGPILLHEGYVIRLCPGGTFVPAPDAPVFIKPREAGDA